MSYHKITRSELKYNLLLSDKFVICDSLKFYDVDSDIYKSIIKRRDYNLCEHYCILINDLIDEVIDLFYEYDDDRYIKVITSDNFDKIKESKYKIYKLDTICRMSAKLFNYTRYTPIILSDEKSQKVIFEMGKYCDNVFNLERCYNYIKNNSEYLRIVHSGAMEYSAKLIDTVPEEFKQKTVVIEG